MKSKKKKPYGVFHGSGHDGWGKATAKMLGGVYFAEVGAGVGLAVGGPIGIPFGLAVSEGLYLEGLHKLKHQRKMKIMYIKIKR